MFRTAFHTLGRGRLIRRPRASRLALESLEPRNLLSFAAPVSYNIGTQSDGFVPNAAPVNVAIGDFNGDGKLDMVVAHKADNTVNILLGNGNGTFQPAVSYAVGEAIEGDVFVGDFNNDGKLDLFLPGDINSANHPIIMLGKGDGTFGSRIDSSSFAVSGTYARGWAVGDFNGDGKLDVVATTPSLSADSGGVVVLLGKGDGTFGPGIANPPPLLHYSRWVTTGDFNGDGKLDLAVADGQGSGTATGTAELTILLGNGDGTFKLGGHYASPGTPGADNLNPEDVYAADLNHDGKLDVIVSDYDQNINVFMGNGDGTFRPAVGYTTGEYPRSVSAADVNGDGKVDLVVNNVGIGPGGAEFQKEGAKPGSVAVLLGNGDGTFQDPIQYNPVPYYPGWTAVGDFNGDGLPDLAVTQVSSGHSVNVMLNQTQTRNQVFAVASDSSLWEYNLSTWQMLSPAGTILSISAAELGDVFALASDHSLWEHNAAGWHLLSPAGTISSISAVTDAAGQAVVYAIPTDASLWEHNNAGWRLLSGAGTILGISAGTDAQGQATVFAIPTDHSLWQFSSTWALLSRSGSILSISAGRQEEVFAVASDNSLWDFRASGWTSLSPAGTILAASAGADSSGAAEVFAITADHTLWAHRSSGWAEVSSGYVLTLSGDRVDQVFAVLSDHSLWERDGTAWLMLSPAGTILSASAPA
jgi:hypothetical protein